MELIKVFDGFMVKIGKNYISSYKNGKYTFTTDYTYARHYSKNTALVHINRLELYKSI